MAYVQKFVPGSGVSVDSLHGDPIQASREYRKKQKEKQQKKNEKRKLARSAKKAKNRVEKRRKGSTQENKKDFLSTFTSYYTKETPSVKKKSNYSNTRRSSQRNPRQRNRSDGMDRLNRSSSRGSRRARRGTGFKVNPSKYVNKNIEIIEEGVTEIRHTFNDFGLDSSLVGNVIKKGFEEPSPIQDQAIPVIMDEKDVVGLANTGTGKTAAFLLPMIHKVLRYKNQKVLIVTPTRELADQINAEFLWMSKGLRLRSAVLIGGTSIHKQKNYLRRNPEFIIGTPGRILDLWRQKLIRFSDINNVILDEADRMLDMGFVEDMEIMLAETAEEKQILFFSATMEKRIRNLIETYADNPEIISVKQRETAKGVYQDVIKVGKNDKRLHLLEELLDGEEYEYAKVLVFTNTKRRADLLRQALKRKGKKAASIHGDKSQFQRKKILDSFRNDRIDYLVATDVAARGLDINGVTHVINFDLPENYEDYVHRIGRTGRAGESGRAYTFIEEHHFESQEESSERKRNKSQRYRSRSKRNNRRDFNRNRRGSRT